MDIGKPAVARCVADQLICDVTGIADPRQRLDLAKASPFVREWAEGVFVWLSLRGVKERTRVNELEALLKRAEAHEGDHGPEGQRAWTSRSTCRFLVFGLLVGDPASMERCCSGRARLGRRCTS